MMATMLAIIDPGDEVVVFEPFYENYGPDAILSGATPRYVTLRPSTSPGAGAEWSFDPDELAAAFNDRTKAIILNTPNNPTGKVFSREELEAIAALCRKWDVIAISDEIYEHIIYDGRRHLPIAAIEGMADRTVTINSLSKTLQRHRLAGGLGDLAADADRGDPEGPRFSDRRCGGAAPGGRNRRARAARLVLPAAGGRLPAPARLLLDILERRRFTCYAPGGAYYIMTDISAFGFSDDVTFARYLVKEVGVAAVPGSSFYRNPAAGRTKLRFCFCKRDETLAEADRRLEALNLVIE